MEKTDLRDEGLPMHNTHDDSETGGLLHPAATDGAVKRVEPAFIPSLEGLRGVAILAVVASHMWPPFSLFSWSLGMMGVTMFFALSGYLITGILMKMQQSRTLVHLPLFFASRTVRLAPSLFLVVGTTVALWLNQGRSFETIKMHALTVLLYLENVFCKEPGHKDMVLAQAWTLAVEEQFYIIWAFLLPVIAAGRMLRRTTMLGFLFAVSIIYRLHMFNTGDMDMMSKSLLANTYALIAGSSLRLLPVPSWFYEAKMAWIGQAIFLCTVVGLRNDAWINSGGIWAPFLTVPATLLTIGGSVYAGNWILEMPLLRHLGRVSYSFYLWHHVFLWLIGSFNRVDIHSTGALSLSWIIAECSTIYMEEPIREYFKHSNWFKNQKAKVAAANARATT